MPFVRRTGATALALILLVSWLPVAASAVSDQEATDSDLVEALPGEGTLVRETPDGPARAIPLKQTTVHATVSGTVASVLVEQRFANLGRETIEAVYLFPLPPTAAVVDVSMRVGARTLRGEIKTREDAKAAYEAARSGGQRASLVEQQSRNLYTSKIANIRPGDEVRVRLRYVQSVGYAGGSYRLAIPLVAAPRPKSKAASATAARPAKRKITTPNYLPEGVRPGHTVSIRVDVNAGLEVLDVNSPSHEIVVTNQEESRRRVDLSRRDEIPNRDFVLEYRVAGESTRAACLAVEAPDGSAYFTINAVPPADAFAAGVLEKEIIFVVDTSGSMQGGSIVEARNALHTLVHGLNPGDAFNIVRFSSDFSAFRASSVPFTQAEVDAADAYIDALRADGGTEAAPAIAHALRQPRSKDRLRVVAFLTDGDLGDPDELMRLIERELGTSRLFTFGIGDAPDDFLARKMAAAGRGSSEFVQPGPEMAGMLERFQNRVAAPVLVDVSVRLDGATISDLSPTPVPDLFASRPLVLYGRADRLPPGPATIEATGPRGRVRFTVPVTVATGVAGEAIASLWARSRVGTLLDALREDSDNTAARDEIVRLGLAHSLVTPFTSFVVVDPKAVAPAGAASKRVVVPLARPESPKAKPSPAAPSPQPPAAPTGELTVVVVDSMGDPVAETQLEVSNDARTYASTTNDKGRAVFPNLEAGSYSVTALSPGFALTQLDGTVAVGQSTLLSIVLQVAGTGEMVDITSGEEAVVQTTTSKLGGSFSSQQVTELPLQGGNALALIAGGSGIGAGSGRSAGADGVTGAGGARTSGGSFTVDGILDVRGIESDSALSPRAARQYLLRRQMVDGSWSDRKPNASIDERLASTASIALAFVGAGETDRAGGYQAQVRRALELLTSQVGADGALPEAVATRTRALVLWALAEAAAATGGRSYQAAAERLARRLVAERLPDGGWAAGPGGASADASATTWALIALASARTAGARVDSAILAGTADLLAAWPNAGAPAPAARGLGLLLAGRPLPILERQRLSEALEAASAKPSESRFSDDLSDAWTFALLAARLSGSPEERSIVSTVVRVTSQVQDSTGAFARAGDDPVASSARAFLLLSSIDARWAIGPAPLTKPAVARSTKPPNRTRRR